MHLPVGGVDQRSGRRVTKTSGWFVTASHAIGPYDDARPYGVQHARQPGALTTECSLGALNWPLFWDRPFKVWGADVCGTCAERTARPIVHALTIDS